MSHITIAASEKGFEKIFTLVRDNFSFATSGTESFGPFSATYTVAGKLSGGTLDLHDDGTIEIKALDVVWTQLKLKVCLNLPGFCVGGWCIVPDPWNGCLVGVPEVCIGGPICIPLDLSGLVSEVNSVKAHLKATYFIDPLRNPAWTDLEAEFNGKPNKWRIFIDPDFVSVDPIDVPASIGNLFERISSCRPSGSSSTSSRASWGLSTRSKTGSQTCLGISSTFSRSSRRRLPTTSRRSTRSTSSRIRTRSCQPAEV
jgi:hypothetical protein